MRIESMIYIYGAVCLSMILFNVVYNLLLKSSRLRLERRCGAVRVRLLPQLIRLRQGLGVEENTWFIWSTLCGGRKTSWPLTRF